MNQQTTQVPETALQAQIRVTIEKAERVYNEALQEAEAARKRQLDAYDAWKAAAPAEHKAWSESLVPEYDAKRRCAEAKAALDNALSLNAIEVAA